MKPSMKCLFDNTVKFLESQVDLKEDLDIEKVTKDALAIIMIIIMEAEDSDEEIVRILAKVKRTSAQVRARESMRAE